MTCSFRPRALTAALLALAAAGGASVAAEKAEAATDTPKPAFADPLFEGLSWRSIGPFRGGRVTAVAGVPGEPLVYYFGATGGGVWKTTNGGIELGAGHRRPGEDRLDRRDRGRAVRPERRLRRHGRELHPRQRLARRRRLPVDRRRQDLDARRPARHAADRPRPRPPAGPRPRLRGRARPRLGPERRARRLPLAGRREDLVEGPLRRRQDGRRATSRWTRRTRASSTPRSGRSQRTPWSLESGGPGSGLCKTTDGGDTWKKLDGKGLPKGPWGQIGVDRLAGADPERVYAIVEAEEGGVFRSDDARRRPGERTNDERKLRQRAWYYTHIYADPKDADTVYVLNVQLFRSKDGGKTLRRRSARRTATTTTSGSTRTTRSG